MFDPTLAQFASTLQDPSHKERQNEWLEAWFPWPPDVFAFTSIVLQRTGCYRHTVSALWSPSSDWEKEAAVIGDIWIACVSIGLRGEGILNEINDFLANPCGLNPKQYDTILSILDERGYKTSSESKRYLRSFVSCLNEIQKLSQVVTLTKLRTIMEEEVWKEKEPTDDDLDQTKKLAIALIHLHAVADESCKHFGQVTSVKKHRVLSHCFGNLLLNVTGSLSTLPKCYGTVLPKMRTPQVGLTLRSLSHHLTFHATEVEVIWRALPWSNAHENSLNLLALPWPFDIEEKSFRPRLYKGKRDRYFRFRPGLKFDPKSLTDLIKKVEHEHEQVHLVVLPETALTEVEFRDFLQELGTSYRDSNHSSRLKYMPTVISGVRNSHHPDDHSELRITEQDFSESQTRNEVRIATYVAGRWYVLSQRKHHRWKLDEHQIQTYGISGRLFSGRGWWEDHEIAQRRLTVFCPNRWLSLCPLICEDLARLEPVSEVIRGVGPTLLVALLLDGPQIQSRWSARYASVFADDPGSAVLSLSALGMINRSNPPDAKRLKDDQRPIALWRDSVNLSRLISVSKSCNAALLTISARSREEFSSDGRSDGSNASTFQLDGYKTYHFPLRAKGSDQKPLQEKRPEYAGGDSSWRDMHELSAVTYLLSSWFQLNIHKDKEGAGIIIGWLLATPHDDRDFYSERLQYLCESILDPSKAGTLYDEVKDRKSDTTESLKHALAILRLLTVKDNESPAEFVERIIGRTKIMIGLDKQYTSEELAVDRVNGLDETEKARTNYVVAQTLLSVMSNSFEEILQRGHSCLEFDRKTAKKYSIIVQDILDQDPRRDYAHVDKSERHLGSH